METSPGISGHRYDVVVAGAGCAGSATALLLARQGLKVLVVDPRPRGRDTLSTHALMRGGVLQLLRWGLLDRVREEGTPAVGTTVFDYGESVIPIPIKPRDGVDALFAPRRTILDRLLVEAAVEAGAEVVHRHALMTLSRDPRGRVVGARIRGPGGEALQVRAGLVVGADGLRSRVANLSGAAILHQAPDSTATVYGYVPGLESDTYRWSFRPGMGAGVIPTNSGDACVFVSVPPPMLVEAGGRGLRDLFEASLARVDTGLAGHVERLGDVVSLRGFAGHPGYIREAVGPGWALVGDAGYFRDPLTAHGITDALRDAELLARAMARDTDAGLQDYPAQRDEVVRGFFEVTGRIAALDWTLEEVQALHHDLNREMNRSLELIRSWGGSSGGSQEAA